MEKPVIVTIATVVGRGRASTPPALPNPRILPARAAALALCAWLPAAAWLSPGTAHATTYTLSGPNDVVVGQDKTFVTVYEDTLYDLARKFSLGSEELIRVNPGVDPWLPGAGTHLVVPDRHILPPAPHEGIVVNLPEHRLYYYPKPKRGAPIEVITYPVSIGKMDWSTPLGLTHVTGKQKDPIWFPPESVRKEHAAAGDPIPTRVPPGPDNPLGAYAMRLAAGNGTYLIHGTNNPIAVGLAVTHGCIRMYPDDVAALFPMIPVGTPVRLINEPVKIAWVDGELLLEAHPPVDAQGQSIEPDIDQFATMLQAAVGDTTVAIHWDYAREVLRKADGVIATVGLEEEAPAPAAAAASPPAADGAPGTDASRSATAESSPATETPPPTSPPATAATPPAAESPPAASPPAAAATPPTTQSILSIAEVPRSEAPAASLPAVESAPGAQATPPAADEPVPAAAPSPPN